MLHHLAGADIQVANTVNYSSHPSRGWQVQGGWEGVLLFFSAYACSDPGSTAHLQKISGISSNQKKYSNPVPLTLKKTRKCIEINLQLAQFCDDPTPLKKYPQNLHTSKKY